MNCTGTRNLVILSNLCLFVSVFATSCGGGGNNSDPTQDAVDGSPPITAVLSNGPFLFEQNLLTNVIPTLISTTSAGGNINTTREVSYSSATRTLSLVSGLMSGGNSIFTSEIVYEFNPQGQVILETSLSNGNLTSVVNNLYDDGLLTRREYRDTFEDEPTFVRTLEYDDRGRFASGVTTDLSSNEISSTQVRVYSENGWITTENRGPQRTTITTELDAQGRIVRTEEITDNGIGGFIRIMEQAFDENGSLVSERRLRGNGELINETTYSDFTMINDVIQDRLYQWNVFFDPSDF